MNKVLLPQTNTGVSNANNCHTTNVPDFISLNQTQPALNEKELKVPRCSHLVRSHWNSVCPTMLVCSLFIASGDEI